MKLSIKHVLIAGIVGLQVVTVSAILFSSYVNTERVLLQHARELMESLAAETIDRSEVFLQPAQTAADLTQRLSDHEVLSHDDPARMERYLFEQLRLHDRFAGIFFGGVDGSFFYVRRAPEERSGSAYATKIISGDGDLRRVALTWRDEDFARIVSETDPTDAYDPRTRPWFTKAVDSGELVWTDPYIFFTSRQPGITTSSPVYDRQGAVSGVVGVDIEIDEISEFLARLKIGENGSAFILGQNGDVIGHPNAELLMQSSSEGPDGLRLTTIEELEDPVGRAAFAALGRSLDTYDFNSQIHTSFTLDGQRHAAIFTPFTSPQWPWVMGIHVPENDFLGAIKQNQKRNIYMAAALTVLACLIGFVLWRSIARPLAMLRENAQRVARGHLAIPPIVDSLYVEISDTAQTFRQMVARLRQNAGENARLTEGLRKFSRAVAQSPAAIVILDPNRRVEYVNPSFTTLTGRTAEDVVGRVAQDVFGAVTDSAGHGYNRAWRTVRSGKIWRGEVKGVRDDGQAYWAAVIISPLRNADDGPAHYVAVATDVTPRKRDEQALRRAGRELEARVEERTRALTQEIEERKRAEERAEQASRVKSNFLANMSHELRTPLNAIIGFADVIRKQLLGPLPGGRYLDYAEDIYASGSHLLQIINDILDISAIEAGRMPLHEDKVDLGDVAKTAVRLIRPQAEARSVHLELKASAGLSTLYADELRLRQIVINLASNAIKFTPPGGRVAITIESEPDGALLLTVADNGIGMTESDIETAMSVFGRVHGGLAGTSEGTGLGLPLTDRLIKAHGGTLRLESRPNEGTKALVRFPPSRVVQVSAAV